MKINNKDPLPLEEEMGLVLEELTELKVKRGRLFYQLSNQKHPDETSLFIIERIRRLDESIERLESNLEELNFNY